MAETAYNLQRFEQRKPEKQPEPRVRVAKKRKRISTQVATMMRTMVLTVSVLVLVCGVLYTQSTITELSTDITYAKNSLAQQQANNTYLTGELDGMVNLRNIDERARALGLVQMDSARVTHVRVNDGTTIEVRKTPLESLIADLQNGFSSVFGGEG